MPPGLQHACGARAAIVDEVGEQVDAAIGQGADREAGEEAEEPVLVAQAEVRARAAPSPTTAPRT